MDVAVLIDLFPPAWLKFFHVMRKFASDPWQKMDEYFNFEFKTHYVEKPSSVTELVAHLGALEPILHDGQIKSVPRLYHFPCLMQRHLVWFIYRHKRELTLSSVCNLVQLLGMDVPVAKDKTLGTAYSLFSSLATKKTVDEKQDTSYTFSRGTRERATTLVRRFSRCVDKQETPPVSPGLQTCIESEDIIVSQHSIHGTQPSFMDICTPEEDATLGHDSSGKDGVKETEKSTKGAFNESKSSSSQISMTLSGSSRKRKMSTSSEQEHKLRKVDDLEIDANDGEGSDSTLPDDLEAAVLSIRNCWSSTNPSSQSLPDLSVFDKLSESEMKAACIIMKLTDLTDAECALACSQLATKSRTLSVCNISVFAEHCILPKLLKLEERCLRVLLDALISFTEKFHRQMTACVFVPLLQTEQLNQYQASVISEVIKDGCNEEQKLYFLSSFVKSKLPWTEVVVSVFHPIINYKMKLGTDDCHNLLSQLSEASVSLSNNLKFTKLLISFINIYASQLNSEDQQQRILHITNVNTTFLKKAAAAALKKMLAK